MAIRDIEIAIATSDRKWRKSEEVHQKRREFLAQQHLDLTIQLMEAKKL